MFLLVLVVFAFPLIYTNSETVRNDDQKVAYELPYVGMLPDNPFYFVKALRDRGMEFTIQNNIKRAEYYLLLSDKRAGMAEMLAKKGKNKLAISTLSKGEKYLVKIPALLKDSKEQGETWPAELLLRLKLSNAKHKEVIETLMKDSPQGEMEEYVLILNLNKQIKDELGKL